MFRKIASFLFLVLSCGISGTFAQTCIPNPVGELEIFDEKLHWDPSENCPDILYRIYIYAEGVTLYVYTVTSLELSIGFLPHCRTYNFSVAAVANHVLGMETYMVTDFLLPDDTDITVQNLNVAQLLDDIMVHWSVERRYASCITSYNLLIYDEDAEIPESWNINGTGYLLEHAPSCMKYRFDVASYYGNTMGSTQTLNYTAPPAINTPTLVEVRQDAVTINTTWSLEKYSKNRCPVTTLYVNGTHFNATYPIEDLPERPNVEVSITGLKANSMYYFNVSLENSAGISEGYEMAVQTLPIDTFLD